MQLAHVPFTKIPWDALPLTRRGTTGIAEERAWEQGGGRVRIVTLEPGYRSDHWCVRGHVVHVLDGEIVTELGDGRSYTLVAGDTYVVEDDPVPHRSRSAKGARLLMVDDAPTSAI